MTSAEPLDTAHRARISADLASTLFVEAGAGTGKTTELVHRILRLVATGAASIDQVAAITFTEAAAAELRERVREALEEAVRSGGFLSEGDRDQECRRCLLALQQVDEAPIQTLHGFAYRLLAQHAVEAGLPPGFLLSDQAEMAVGFERSWERFLRQLLQDPAFEKTLGIALKLGLRLDNLKTLARQLRDQWDLVCQEPPVPPPLSPANLTALLEKGDHLLANLTHCYFPGVDKLALHLDVDVRGALDRIRTLDPSDEAALYRAFLGLRGTRNGRAANWKIDKNQVLADMQELLAERDAVTQRLTEHVMDTLFAALVRFTLAEARARRQAGELEFHDLLVRVLALLDDVNIRDTVRARYSHLLIDEFQDTDPLQVALASRLAAPPHHEAPSDLLGTEPGRLFLVGDPKQSIYRFRRADIDVYTRAREQLAAPPTRLTVNFRSRPRILRFVNDAFGPSSGADLGVDWQDLHAYRSDEPSGLGTSYGTEGPLSTVSLLGGRHAGTAEEANATMAADLVAAIALVKNQGWAVGYRYTDTDGHQQEATRPARYDDIAILLRTRTSLGALERALSEAGVPYRIESRSLAWSTQEVRDLLAVLGAIEDPTNEIATVAALSSVILGCTLPDLQEWRRAWGAWRADVPGPASGVLPSNHPVAEAMGCLRRWAGVLHRTTVPALCELILRERRVLEAALAHRQYRQSQGRYRFLVDQARAWVEQGGVTLGGFLHHVATTEAADGAVRETVVPDTDNEAVRITTIHAAKGLEYPVVVVAGLGTRPHYGESAAILWHEGRPYMRCGPLKRKDELAFVAAGYTDLDEVEVRHGQEELARLLYVACTRARDHLVVGLHHCDPERRGSPRATSPAARLNEWTEHVEVDARTVDELAALHANPAHLRVMPVCGNGKADEPGSEVSDAADSHAENSSEADEAERVAQQLAVARVGWAQAVAAAERPLVLAATAVGALEDPDVRMLPGMWQLGRPQPEEEVDTLDPGAGGRASVSEFGNGNPTGADLVSRGREFGSAVHMVLEEAELRPDWLGLKAAAERAATAFGADPKAVEQAALSALQTVTVRSAGQAVAVHREVFVAATIEDVIVEGFVDLVYDDGAGLVVVDWKTDTLTGNAAMAQAVEHHSPQLATYALALEAVTGRTVRRAVLVFCGNGQREASEFMVRDLAGHKAAVLRRLRHSHRPSTAWDRQ